MPLSCIVSKILQLMYKYKSGHITRTSTILGVVGHVASYYHSIVTTSLLNVVFSQDIARYCMNFHIQLVSINAATDEDSTGILPQFWQQKLRCWQNNSDYMISYFNTVYEFDGRTDRIYVIYTILGCNKLCRKINHYIHCINHNSKVAYHSVDLIHSKCKVCCLEASGAEAFQNTAIVNTIVKIISFYLHRLNWQLATCYQYCFLCNARSCARHY